MIVPQIQLLPLTTLDYEAQQEIEKLFLSAFPANERPCFDVILQRLEHNPAFYLQQVRFQGDFIGFCSYWQWSDFCYLEHLATTPAVRNKGMGAHIMNKLKVSLQLPLVLEVELPEDEITKRRIGFYERLGFHLHADISYMQPSYQVGGQSIPLLLMTYGDIDFEKMNVVNRIHREVYKG